MNVDLHLYTMRSGPSYCIRLSWADEDDKPVRVYTDPCSSMREAFFRAEEIINERVPRE